MSADQEYHHCAYCPATFKKKRNWYEHEVVCELLYKDPSTTQITATATTDDVNPPQPTFAQLYQIVQKLAKNQKMLDAEIQNLKRRTDFKVNIFDWLTNNMKPTVSISSVIVCLIKTTPEDINYLLYHTMKETLKRILESAFHLTHWTKKPSEYPLFAQSHKLYIYDYETNKWQIENYKNTSFCEILWTKINDNLLAELMYWKKQELKKPGIIVDEIDTLFNKTLLKIVDINQPPQQIKYIRHLLCEFIQSKE